MEPPPEEEKRPPPPPPPPGERPSREDVLGLYDWMESEPDEESAEEE